MVYRKCRIAPDGTRIPEGTGSPKLLHRSSGSTLVTKTDDGDQKRLPVAVADPVLESVSVY